MYFYTYSLAADFSPIDVVIDSEGFYNSGRGRAENFNDFAIWGEQRAGVGRREGWGGEAGGEGREAGVRRSESATCTPEETLTRLGRCDFNHFTEERRRRGKVSGFVVPLPQVNYTFRIY